MSYPLHVLGFAGSTRAHSVNAGLLRAAGEVLPEGMTLEIIDLAGIPFFDQDLLDSGEVPEAVQTFKAKISEANALLIATPEYNYSVPGILKNAIDWASRPIKDSPLNGKPLAMMGAGGRMGTSRAQAHLRQIALGTNMQALTRPEVMVVQFAPQKFDAQGNLTDDATRLEVKALMVALDGWTRRLRGVEQGLMERAKVREIALG
jgi:chromate reductase